MCIRPDHTPLGNLALDGDRCHQVCVAPHKDFVLDHRLVLRKAIVIARDRPRPNVDLRPQRRVPDIRQVRDLGPCPQHRFLHLAEIAHLRLRLQPTLGPEMCIRPDHTPLGNLTLDDHGAVQDRHPLVQVSILNPAVGIEHAPRPDGGRSLKDDPGVDDSIGADRDGIVDIGGCGVEQGDAGGHQTLVHPVPQE